MKNKKLPKEWIHVIGKGFFIQECGGFGDCLFHVFAIALNDKVNENIYNANNIRESIAHSLEYSLSLLPETWDHYLYLYHAQGLYQNVHTLKDFQKLIRTMGSTYEGDDITLTILKHLFEVNVILLNSHETSFYCRGDKETYNNYILIWYIDGIHYQIVGYECETNQCRYYWFTKENISDQLINAWRSFCHKKKNSIKYNQDIKIIHEFYEEEKKMTKNYKFIPTIKAQQINKEKMIQELWKFIHIPFQEINFDEQKDIILFKYIYKGKRLDHPRIYHCKYIENNKEESFWICTWIDTIKQKIINENKELKILPHVNNNTTKNSMIHEWNISSSNIYINENFLNYLMKI